MRYLIFLFILFSLVSFAQSDSDSDGQVNHLLINHPDTVQTAPNVVVMPSSKTATRITHFFNQAKYKRLAHWKHKKLFKIPKNKEQLND